MEKGQIKIAEQEEILDTTDKNLIVSASAGSGKTTIMIRKILKYVLEEGCHIDELLVLTYTKSAALEMKKKLTNKLKENLENNPGLQQELDLVQTSDISTFDSFCQKLIKKYFYVLNIDPSFSILDSSDATFYQNNALEKALKNLQQTSPEDYENLLNNFSPSRDERTIKALVLEIYNYMISVFGENEFIETTNKLYNPELKIAEQIIKEYYNNIFMNIVKNLDRLKQQALDFGFNEYTLPINEVVIFLEGIIRESDFCKMLDLLQDVKFPTIRTLGRDEIGFSKKISAEKDFAKKQIDKIKEQYVSSENIKNSYKSSQNLIKNLIKLLFLFKNEYFLAKQSLGSYDFDDIERFAIKLLQDDKINAEIKGSYKHIFVDEFQDANKVQEKIIFLLNNNNLFFVGDTKQSIYAFRQSDPEIFLNIEKNFKQDTLNSCAKTLNCNFRTNKNILEFVNKIFSVVMTETTCGINYEQNAQFTPKADYKDVENEKCVSLNVLLEDEKELLLPDKIKVYSVKENAKNSGKENKFNNESLFICQKILSLLGEKIYDKEQDKFRQISYSDIKILLLKRGKFLDNLIQNFTELNIPFIVNVNQNLEDCYDNQVLYNIMRLSCNFYDDYALYSVMSSPMFNFSDSELAQIKMANSQEPYFYNCVLNYSENETIRKKIDNFISIVNSFKYTATFKGIYNALQNIVDKTNYLLNISFDEDFQERQLNICGFINSFAESKYNYNLSEYLIYRETSTRQEKVQTDKTFSNAVEITTMHSSKGLEYPVVILPYLNMDYTKSAYGADIKINKDLGIGIKSYNQEDRTVAGGIFFNACKIKNQEIEISEKIRLLYVAMTRAKNKLILCGTFNKEFAHISNNLQTMQTNNYLSLIVGALPENVISKINEREDFETTLYNNDKLELVATHIQTEVVANNIQMPTIADEENVQLLADFLNKDLSLQKSNLALKNAVSMLASDENASNNFAPKNLSISEHLTEKASDKGTLYHSLLEKIDFFEMHSSEDVKDFIECNFNDGDILTLQKIGYDNIYNNINILKSYINKTDKVFKEQKFVMYVSYNEVVNSNKTDKILVQGIIDLMVIKPKEILLIDYKLSKKTSLEIKSTYSKQLDLYALALQKQFKNVPINKKILSLNMGEMIDM